MYKHNFTLVVFSCFLCFLFFFLLYFFWGGGTPEKTHANNSHNRNLGLNGRTESRHRLPEPTLPFLFTSLLFYKSSSQVVSGPQLASHEARKLEAKPRGEYLGKWQTSPARGVGRESPEYQRGQILLSRPRHPTLKLFFVSIF